jgi:hypothetical protein
MLEAADSADNSARASLWMKVKASSKATSAAVEYFLYAIVIIQTAIAAFAYKTLSQPQIVWPGAVVYLAVIYFGVLGWVFYQLNRLHVQRKAAASLAASEHEPAGDAVSLQIENGAMEISDQPSAVAVPARLVFGITRAKLAIVLLVFLGALKVFSWALSNLIRP